MVKVFVYGTLKSGGKLDLGLAVSVKGASIYGNLYEAPGGAFPCAVLEGGTSSNSIVYGEVHEYHSWALDLLDESESEGFLYERVRVYTIGGEEVWTYQYLLPTGDLKRIEGGVW